MATTKLEELEAEWKQVRGDLVTRGLLSDSSKPEGAMARIIDGLIFIAKGQHKEIADVKRSVRRIHNVHAAGRRTNHTAGHK